MCAFVFFVFCTLMLCEPVPLCCWNPVSRGGHASTLQSYHPDGFSMFVSVCVCFFAKLCLPLLNPCSIKIDPWFPPFPFSHAALCASALMKV